MSQLPDVPEMRDPLAGVDPDADLDLLHQPRKRLSRRRLYVRRFLRNKPAVVGLVLFVLMCLFAAFGNVIGKHDFQETDFLALSTGPTPDHWFGTNAAGNDLYAQTVHGLQRSLLIAVFVSVATVAISAVVGASAAYFGGLYEWFWLHVIHFLLVVPTFLLLALLSNSSGGNWLVIAVILALTSWFLDARTIWTLSLSLRERDYVLAAKFMGVPGFRIVTRHLIPHMSSLLVLNLSLGVVLTVQTETALSFLGFGVKEPDVSLGSLIGLGSDTISSSPWLFYFPAGALTLLTVSMALISDGLRDAFDPSSAAGGQA
jgi:peptide/nickel transport system permease protein